MFSKRRRFSYNVVSSFLRSNIGQSWNKLYSELAHRYGKGRKRHILEDNLRWLIRSSPGPGFHVTPAGLLAYQAPSKKKHPRHTTLGIIAYMQGFEVASKGTNRYLKSGGVWYLLNFAKLSKEAFENPDKGIFKKSFNDVVLGYRDVKDLKRIWGKPVYAVSKKQLNSRELKKLGLVND